MYAAWSIREWRGWRKKSLVLRKVHDNLLTISANWKKLKETAEKK